jgi:hypothetical protein
MIISSLYGNIDGKYFLLVNAMSMLTNVHLSIAREKVPALGHIFARRQHCFPASRLQKVFPGDAQGACFLGNSRGTLRADF